MGVGRNTLGKKPSYKQESLACGDGFDSSLKAPLSPSLRSAPMPRHLAQVEALATPG